MVSILMTYNGTLGAIRGKTGGDEIARITLEDGEYIVGFDLDQDRYSDYLCRMYVIVANREGSLIEWVARTTTDFLLLLLLLCTIYKNVLMSLYFVTGLGHSVGVPMELCRAESLFPVNLFFT